MMSDTWFWMSRSGIPKPTAEQCAEVARRVTRGCSVCGRYGECWNLRGVFVCSNRALYGSCDPINDEDED